MYCTDPEIELCPACAVMQQVEQLLSPMVLPSVERRHHLITNVPLSTETVINRWLENETIIGVGIVTAVARGSGHVELVEIDTSTECGDCGQEFLTSEELQSHACPVDEQVAHHDVCCGCSECRYEARQAALEYSLDGR